MNEQWVQLQQLPKPWKMFKAMLSIGTICAALLVFVFYFTAPIIAENHQRLLQASIFKLYPDTQRYEAYVRNKEGKLTVLEQSSPDAQFYRIYGQDKTIGYVVKANGMGYQDTIHLLYSYKAEQQVLGGYVILSSRETPGLGTKIETDERFLAQFKQLPMTLNNERSALLNPIVLAKKGKKEKSWQIDGISGATVSSRALVQILANSSEFWIPKLVEQYERTRTKH